MKNANSAEPILGEYGNNPFIARLPPLIPRKKIFFELSSPPEFQKRERSYPAYIRKHCIMRLGRYFEPLERQIQLAERFGMLLRQGYVGRNPLTHDYIRHLQNGADRIEAKSLHISTQHPVQNTANSFALIGCSGIGKSKSIEKVMHQYPQCIDHVAPFSLVQIVWLKLDCPTQGSPKQLCINFFAAIDRLIGTNYFKWYGNSRDSVEVMMLHMAQIANLHALGVLVVDEIQHLNNAKIGSDALLSFLVTLVNTIGVPIILIGTLSAGPLLQENFRHARRASGLGSLIWDRLPKDKSWDYFLDQLWQYQWTRDFTPMTPEIRKVMYDESQGLVDVLVKLFMLGQLRAVNIGDARQTQELMTPTLFKKVAREDFRLVQPMLSALRRNDTRTLLKYDDLLPLQRHVEKVMASALNTQLTEIEQITALDETKNINSCAPMVEPPDPIRDALHALGIADDVVEILIRDATLQNPSADPLLLMAKISETLTAQPAIQKKPKAKSTDLPSEDLRHVVAEGKSEGWSGYEALFKAGIIKPPIFETIS